MLVQGSSILEFVEIDMSTFDSHVLQEVGAGSKWATCSIKRERLHERAFGHTFLLSTQIPHVRMRIWIQLFLFRCTSLLGTFRY